MYNEEASKYGATMATGFALLSGQKYRNLYIIGTKMGMEATKSYQNLKSREGLIIRKKTR
jgi:hypothetical protein